MHITAWEIVLFAVFVAYVAILFGSNWTRARRLDRSLEEHKAMLAKHAQRKL